MKRKITAAIIFICMIGVLVVGCGAKPTEPSYASSLTDKVLTAINQDDYASFSQDFTQTMLTSIPEAAFHQLSSQLKGKIGDYVSKQFQSAGVQNGITTVIYKAKYTKANSVTITISFETVSGKTLVAGLYFNAPELQQ